ncbi:MAG: hypothetical protein NC078_07860 [Ruminococcus sp.]|nr:hypothetical protein [Ruminococcus sp.]
MSERYSVIISGDAYDDRNELIDYITYVLKEPGVARKKNALLNKAIYSLDVFPEP